MMKISAILILMILNPSYAVLEDSIEVPKYGGCLNETAYDEDPTTGYHCHFSGRSCMNGEKYLSPMKAEAKGLPKCTCDEDYNNNVYVNKCYSMNTHQVTCIPTDETCPEMDIGPRSNSGLVVPESCGHGSAAYGAFEPPSCGKRCTCNYDYQKLDYQVMAATTMYGMCYNSQTHQGRCSAMKDHCDSSEMYVDSTHALVSGKCPCTEVEVGACIRKNGKFKSCAMAADSCATGHIFLSPLELLNSEHDHTCRLCKDTWNCVDNEEFTSDAGITCQKMSKKRKAKQMYCEDPDVKDNCPRMCGSCCADDMGATFTVLEEEVEINCAEFKLRDDKDAICKSDGKLEKICARTCKKCCKDDATAKFKVPGRDNKLFVRNCKW
eukprot:CAMPEP_0194322832 /NCGR_PEP_ID=MMETSP0171-20130528/22422_1 /TAXON_ID=218684 /ORGANISM="Corethron pennatum, Strain L29A3" /LENGTH=379 /DNA_ID=CAMNT_0039081223 /DNA_START=74 /DNA_END=1210 /DNA_ORIENTATION=+